MAELNLLNAEEMAAFNRFCECCEDFDSGGYDVDKVMMLQLARIGVVRSIGFGRYETTKFGDIVRDSRTAPVSAPMGQELPPRIITEETAQSYMEEMLWAFIECAGNFPSIKPDERTWPHVRVYMPRIEVEPPVAPKGPFADYSAEEVEFYASQYVAPYAERIRHLEREQLPKLDDDDEVSFPGDGKLAVLHDARYWELRGAEERVAELERELAERKQASIGDDGEFLRLLGDWMAGLDYFQSDEHKEVKAKWDALIAYIDGRTAGTAPEDRHVESEAVSTMLWLYRRLPHAYGRPPNVEKPITDLAKLAGYEMKFITESFAERATKET